MKFGWEELFDLEDDKQINDAIKLIERLDDVYTSVINSVASKAAKYKKAMQEIADSTKKLEKQLQSLSPITEDNRKKIAEIGNTADVAAKQQETLKTELVALEGTVGQLTDEQKKYNQQAEETLKLNKDREKLAKKLISLEGNEAKEVAKLRVEIQEKNKELKQSARESLGLVSIYQKESKRLIELRKDYKDLALSKGINAKETKALQKEIDTLDSTLKEVDANAGQFQRNVGNYPELFDNMGGAMGKSIGSIKGVGAAFKALIANPVGVIIMAIVLAATALWNGFKKLAGNAEMLEKIISGLTITFNTLLTRIGKLLTGELSFREFLFDTTDAIKEQIRASNELITLRRRLERVTADTALAEAKLGDTIAKLTFIRDNDSKSLKQREKAGQLYIDAIKKQNQVKLDLIDQETRATKLAVDITESGSEDRRLAEIEYTKALAKQVVARTEAYREEQDAIKELEMIRLDQFEQELDLLLDIEDRRKSVNERAIADEETVLSEKQRLLRENVKSIEKSFNQQIETYRKFFGVQLDVNKLLNLSGKELYEYTANLGLSERAVNRLREVVIEKLAADRDNLDSMRAVSKELEVQTNLTERFNEVRAKANEERLKDEEKGRKTLLSGWRDYYNEIERKAAETYRNSSQYVRDGISNVLNDIQDGVNSFGIAFADMLYGFTERANQKDEERISRLESRKERELQIVGDNANGRAAIEQRYARDIERIEEQQRKRRRRQAIYDKAINVTNAIINTARAVVEALPNVPLSIAVGTIGALQTAAILAQPIPTYAKGTDYHKGGAAIVGDGGGRELIMEPGGKFYLSPSNSTLMDLPEGAKVFDHITTQRMLSDNNEAANEVRGTLYKDREAIVSKQARVMAESGNAAMVDAFKYFTDNMEVHKWEMDGDDIKRTVRKGNTIRLDWKKTNSYE